MISARSFVLLALSALLVLATTFASAEARVRTFAVRTLPGADEIAAAVREGAFQRWVVPRDDSLKLAVGPEAAGDVEIEVQLLPADERLRRRLAALPVGVGDDGLRLGGTIYADRRYALAVRLPEPERPTWVVVGHEARAAAALADRLLMTAAGVRWRRSRVPDVDYLLWEHPWSQRSGRWQKTGAGYAVDPEERDDMAARAAAYAAAATVARERVVLRVPPEHAGDPRAPVLADRLAAAVREMAPRVPVTVDEPLEVLVARDFVEQGRHLADIGETVLDDAGRLHLVYHEGDLDAYRYGVARALVRRAALALPPWLEDGAALWLARGWYGRPYAAWLPDLAFARVLPGAAEILAQERQGDGSEVLWPPVVAAVVERLPGATLRAKLASPPPAVRVAEILRQVEEEAARELGFGVSGGGARPAAFEPAFLNGVSLAMANGLEVGYHAPALDEQLVRLGRLGADSVSLMPFAGQRSPTEPRMGYYNGSPSSETDVGMIHAARRARARGFRVLWKPHIWVSHSSWPGEIAMASEADWAAWWASYRRFVLHHAVLAEWTGSELFSVGVELGKTLAREAEWRHLIAAVRRVFSGSLTYSGNWWGDYDRVPFWDALDLVGVDAYFPLAGRADADRAALAAGARRAVAELAAAAERYGKPVLLTEVGFAARRGAWIAPHEEGGDYAEEPQALAYEALLGALGRPPWLAGVYVWKAFSHPSIESGERPSFHFLGRRAEAVVRGYFGSAPSPPVATAR